MQTMTTVVLAKECLRIPPIRGAGEHGWGEGLPCWIFCSYGAHYAVSCDAKDKLILIMIKQQ